MTQLETLLTDCLKRLEETCATRHREIDSRITALTEQLNDCATHTRNLREQLQTLAEQLQRLETLLKKR
jgi:chromosome segregation ATPase